MLLAEAWCVFLGFILYISGVQGRTNSICALKDLQVKVIPTTEGQTVSLMCSTSCPLTENPAVYIWYKNGEFLYKDWSPWYQQLVSSEEAVTYSCAIKGYEDLRAPEVSVGLTVKFAPSAVVTEGQRVTLTCSTSCPLSDNTNYIWYLNSRPLTLPENQHKQLVLDPVSSQHAGRYSCAVKTHNIPSSFEKTLTVHSNTGKWTAAAAAGGVAVLLVITALIVFFWVRKKRSSSRSPTTETSLHVEQLNPDVMYENISAQSTEQDDHHYSRLHFSKNHKEDLYSTLQTAQ
ncbi:hypothetical protein D5F01_LYC00637 [Larimichthys crocea]|uniref:Ig-like domain-containing protein n=1 Tax=Larimichthys crocea TaxID=215358 RepID=A0A6G0JAK5_LARCR|nr:hypothetical protein D5F01_LYC00637 [Larimichthys crocea]